MLSTGLNGLKCFVSGIEGMDVSSQTLESPTPRHGMKGDELVRHLRSAIQKGRYAPGQRLVEIDLTEELGISRSLLREAFRRLSAEGLLEIVPNRGALVHRLSLKEALELFQIRMELEALAARLAAQNMGDPATRQTFETDVAAIWEADARLSTSAYVVENEKFHAAVFSASGNEQLSLVNRQLQLSLIMAQISSSLTPEIMAQSNSEHRAIAKAVLECDTAAADAAARAHLGRAQSFVSQMPENVFRSE